MTILLLILGAGIVLTAAGILWAHKTPAYDDGPIIFTILSGLVTVIVAFAVVIILLAVHYDRASCHSYAKQTGRSTRFVRYPGLSWDCLTKAHDGHWIPTDQIGDYNK